VVDVAWDDCPPRATSLADEIGGYVVGNRRRRNPAVPRGRLGELRAPEILADRDIFHLGRDDAAPGIMHLADVGAGPGAEHLAADVGEGLDAAASGRAGHGRYPRADLALEHLLDVAAAADPVRAQLGQARHDVDPRLGVGIGPGAIVDASGGSPDSARDRSRASPPSRGRHGSCGCRGSGRW
jgi:hypothetical protein